MLEAVATKLIALISAAVLSHGAATAPIPAGAPDWFNRPLNDRMCVSVSLPAEASESEPVENAVFDAMASEINTMVNGIIMSEFDQVMHPPSIRLLELAGNDVNLDVFVRRNLRFTAAAYDNANRIAYRKGCIRDDRVIEYETARITTIQRSLLRR